jgi:hypothetical protein
MSDHDTGPSEFAQIKEEFLQDLRVNGRPSIEDYALRYPHLAADIRELFPLLRRPC